MFPKLKKAIKYLFYSIPFILGTYGYTLVYGDNILGALYSALRLYGLSVDVSENEINPFLQIARWLAVVVTTTVICLLFQRTFREAIIRWKIKNRNTIVIHGDGYRKEELAKKLGKSAIKVTSKICFHANRHILAFDSDSSALRYYQDNAAKFLDLDNNIKEKNISFSAIELQPSDHPENNIHISNASIDCARLYWKDNWINAITEDSITKIVIIGFGEYGKKIFEQSLLVNVLPYRKSIEYHIFDSQEINYINWHPFLSNIISINKEDSSRDCVFFHTPIESDSLDGLKILKSANRIIIASDSNEENLLFLNKLLILGIQGPFHIKGSKDIVDNFSDIFTRERDNITIQPFGDDNDLYSEENLFNDKLCKEAKKAHEHYVRSSDSEKIKKKYSSCNGCKRKKCSKCQKAQDTWKDLSPFERASNIALIDHRPVKEEYLKGYESSNVNLKLELMRIEHERWCRLYYLHNWQFGSDHNAASRTHPCLRPFDELPEDMKKYDWNDYEFILKQNR